MFTTRFTYDLAKVLLVGLLLAGQQAFSGFAGPADATAQTFELTDESRMYIDGTSTVNSFTCESEDVEGRGALILNDDRTARTAAWDEDSSAVTVRLRVADLRCGHPAMNRDLYESLKGDEHPRIHFTLTSTHLLAGPETNDGRYLLRAYGNLSLAGTEREISVIVEGERMDDGRLHGWGAKDLKMTDFGVEPPTALFGLVRAHNDITVRFDLVAEARR